MSTTAAPAMHAKILQRIADDLARTHQGTFSSETIERYVFESYTSLARTAKIHTYLPVLAERFATDRLRALALAEGKIDSPVPQVLFACVHVIGVLALSPRLCLQRRGDLAVCLLHLRCFLH